MSLSADKIKKYWRIFWALRRIVLINRMAYRVNFFIACFAVFLYSSMTIIFLKTIFRFMNNFSGWNYYQAMAVVATFILVEGTIWVMCACLIMIQNHVKQGTFDGLLVRPVDTLFLVSFWRGDGEDLGRIITGLALLFYSVSHLTFEPGTFLPRIILYVILLFNSCIITYSIFLILRSFSFWFIEIRSFGNFGQTLTQFSQYPADIFYHKIIKAAVFSIVPIAFMATVPAKILTFGIEWKLVSGSFVVAALFFFVSRRFWVYALKHYSSASS
jgi:ABC-2 type transport system permease protein